MTTPPNGDPSSRLLQQITHCSVVAACKHGGDHPCADIVAVQQDRALVDHQVPEPWNGHLNCALILFVSSNPSISDTEHYPTWGQDAATTGKYFTGRFDGGPGQVKDGVYPPQADGTYGKAVPFWASVRARAQEVLPDPVPGTDYAVTEVVHCKSRGEVGVAAAAEFCSRTYLADVVAQAKAVRLMVVYGKHARNAVNRIFNLDLHPGNRHAVMQTNAGSSVHVVALDHPAGAGKVKKLATALGAPALEALREQVTGARAARDRFPKYLIGHDLAALAWPPPGTPRVLAQTGDGALVLWSWADRDNVKLTTEPPDWEPIFGDEIPYYAWDDVTATTAWVTRSGWKVLMYQDATGGPVHVAEPSTQPEREREPEPVPFGTLGDLPGPRHWHYAPRDILDAIGPWTWAIPDLFAALGDPACAFRRPRYIAQEENAEAIAMWSALLTLCWGVFGWPNPALGLYRWLAAGCPTQDPAGVLLAGWWGRDVEAIIHWDNCSPALQHYSARIGEAVGVPVPRHRPVRPRSRPPEPVLTQLISGGRDPLHLEHVVSLLVIEPDYFLAPVRGADSSVAYAHTVRYSGWYRALHAAGEMLPPPGEHGYASWLVNVIVPSLPPLGQFERSPVTGRWHACSPWWHLLGYPL